MHLIVAICAEEIAGHQSPRYGVNLPAWNLRQCFPAEDGKYLVFASFCSYSKSTKTNTGMQQHEYACVSVLEKYSGPRKAGHIVYIMYIMDFLHILMGWFLTSA